MAGRAEPAPAPPQRKLDAKSVQGYLASVRPDGVVAALVTFVLCWAIARFLWSPLSWPPRFLNVLIGTVAPGDCIQYPRGTQELEWCAAVVGVATIAGPLIVIVIMFVFRRQLAKFLKAQAARLPKWSTFLVAPLITTVIFTIGWAGINHSIPNRQGIVEHITFPALVGFITYAGMQWGRRLHARMGGFLTARDKFPFLARLGAVILVPIVLSLSITQQARVSDSAMKVQAVVLVAIALAWLLLTPRMDGKPKSSEGPRPRRAPA